MSFSLKFLEFLWGCLHVGLLSSSLCPRTVSSSWIMISRCSPLGRHSPQEDASYKHYFGMGHHVWSSRIMGQSVQVCLLECEGPWMTHVKFATLLLFINACTNSQCPLSLEKKTYVNGIFVFQPNFFSRVSQHPSLLPRRWFSIFISYKWPLPLYLRGNFFSPIVLQLW